MHTEEILASRMAEYVEMCDYPLTKQELLRLAEEYQFPDKVMDVLEDLPRKTYESEADVMEEVEAALGLGTNRRILR